MSRKAEVIDFTFCIRDLKVGKVSDTEMAASMSVEYKDVFQETAAEGFAHMYVL